MMTHFTIWHWTAVTSFSLLFLFLVLLSLKEAKQKDILAMIFSSFLVVIMAGAFSLMALDKYTKTATLYGVKNTRILRNETIIFTGFVKNKGDYTIGKIILTVKLVNKGHATGNVKGGSFFKPSGLLDFFSSFTENKKSYKVQKVENTYTVATMIEPGKAKYFRVEMPYPPHFKHVAEFTSISAH
ncbi:DUF2393 family protein [Sulfurimonas sp. MAG313]|nr:DUF2393 family protein [Sulfurimonas sp. MAG313]MDF1880290.1 DUF2393 family protein [Sulfurimonas sp. MAG313]